MRGAFARYAHTPGIAAALATVTRAGSKPEDAKHNEHMRDEALRMITIGMVVAGSGAPCRLVMEVIKRLYQDPVTRVPQFHKDPHNFVLGMCVVVVEASGAHFCLRRAQSVVALRRVRW